jgi:hypothetical protein
LASNRSTKVRLAHGLATPIPRRNRDYRGMHRDDGSSDHSAIPDCCHHDDATPHRIVKCIRQYARAIRRAVGHGRTYVDDASSFSDRFTDSRRQIVWGSIRHRSLGSAGIIKDRPHQQRATRTDRRGS